VLIVVLVLCSFAVATAEFVLVGLLPEIAADLAVSVPAAGQLVTVYMLVARDYGVGWRILPCPQTLEAEFVFVIGERAGNVGGEELGRDLTNHGSSVRRALSTVAGLRLSTWRKIRGCKGRV